MKSFFEEYSRLIGLILLVLVVILLFSTPSTFFAKSITTIDTELSHASGKEIMVEMKLDFGNNGHMRAFPMNIDGWKGSDYNTERVAKSLGADVMLMRAYSNPKSYQPVFFLIVQSRNRSSFHPPVVCYPALGYTIEEEGKDYVFSAQLQDVLDDAIFKNLCGVFKRAIKKKEAFNKISKQTKETKVKALKGKEIDV